MIERSPTPARPRVFYGWYVVGVCMLAGFIGCGLSQLFMALMLKPVTEEFGWSRTAASGAITAGTVAAGLAAPIFGRLTDLHGPRPIIATGAVVGGLIYLGLSGMSELWQFYALYIVGRSIGSASFAGVVPTTAITNWFRRMRGRAIGMIATASPFGTSLLAFSGQLVIEEHGWRTVFQAFGIAMLVILVPVAVLVLRRRPEDLGLLPDGDVASGGRGEWGRGRGGERESGRGGEERKPKFCSAAPRVRGSQVRCPPLPHSPTPPLSPEFSWTVRDAMRTRSFWLLAGGISVAVMAEGAIGFHQVAYYTDVGVATTAAALALSVYGLAGAVGNGLWGFLIERLDERYLAASVMLTAAALSVVLLFVRSPAGAIAFSVAFGLVARGEISLGRMIIAQYFGRSSYGVISGIVSPFQLAGLGLGPTIAAVAFDATGTYRGVFVVCAALFVVAATLVWFARKPVPPAVAVVTRSG